MRKSLLTLPVLLILSVGGTGLIALVARMVVGIWPQWDAILMTYGILGGASVAYCVWRYFVEWRWE